MTSHTPPKAYFLVTSHGRTATYWLASCLNAHPDVVCSHGSLLPPVLEYGNQPPDQGVPRQHEGAGVFYRTPLAEFFEALEAAAPGRAYGNVHAYSAHVLQALPHLTSERHTPVVFNLVRHPVTRIESLKRCLTHALASSPLTRRRLDRELETWAPPELLDRLREIGPPDPGESDGLAFLYAACFVTGRDRLDVKTPVPHIPMERLVKDIDYFAYVFTQLTQGAVSLSGDYLRRVAGRGPVNVRVEEGGAVARVEAWSSWMRRVVSVLLEDDELARAYAGFGYDLSFLRGTPACGVGSPGDSRAPTVTAPGGERPSVLLELGYCGFHILQYADRVYAVEETGEAPELDRLSGGQLAELERDGRCLVGASVDDVKRQIQGRHEGAVAEGARGVAADLERGNRALDAQAWIEACDALIRVLQREPESAAARSGLGLALLALGEAEEGLAQLQEGVRLTPSPDHVNNLACGLMHLGRLDEAERLLRGVLALVPNHPGAAFNWARLCEASRDTAGAMA